MVVKVLLLLLIITEIGLHKCSLLSDLLGDNYEIWTSEDLDKISKETTTTKSNFETKSTMRNKKKKKKKVKKRRRIGNGNL